MKKLVPIAALAALTITAHAQQTNALGPLPTPDSFLGTAGSYFTSFNTNLASTFNVATNSPTPYHGSLWTGAVLQNNVNLGQEIGLSYNVGKSFSIEAATLNAGVFNTILWQEIGVGYNIVIQDTKLTGGLAGVYRFDHNQAGVGGFLMLEKALTTHTFFGLKVEVQSGGKNDLVPQLTAMTGFTF